MTLPANTTVTTLAPPSGLVVANPTPGSPPLFCLFTKDWLTMQAFIAQAIQLPIAVGDFQSKYGTFSDEAEVKGCVAAMQAVQALGTTFGDPVALVKQLASNPAILQTDTAPDQLYVHIVWFATKLYQTATSYNQTLAQFMQVLNAVPANQLQEVVTQILVGPGGLQSNADTMKSLTNDLIQKLAQFTSQLNPAVTTMNTYTANSSKFYKDVNDAIGADAEDVKTFQHEADVAYKLWRDLTISAVTTSVGVMVLTAGLAWPISATLAGVLGDQAKKARDAYNKACQERDDAASDEQKKMTLLNDLGAFNSKSADANTAALAFKQDLEQVLGVWTTIGSNLDFIAKNFTPDKFDGLPAWRDAMMLDQATQDWHTIADKANEYTANSLVSYNIVPFGQQVPDPAS
ncbi:alpha-xenorhabdolysin family binary toxin subunit A [Pseudomonas sp. NPDC089406]|uniref:alpha-xenorhabdolysin family binary toxin subunit A n=1 Tax=Pseudomonas sp. NPDC089406 TaxID=3364463 RepID=UPI00384BE7C6